VSVAETEAPAETETPDTTEQPGESITEPEPPELEPEPEPTEPAEPPAPVIDEAAMEKFYKSLGTRTTTFNNWLAGELGEQAEDLSLCPLCSDGIMGHIYPPEWVTPTSDLQARLLDVLKTPSAPEYRDAPNVRQCGTCGGFGVVLSGSRVPGKERVVCQTCKGNGFQGDQAVAPMPQATNGSVDFELPPDTEPLVSADADIWGSPRVLDDGQDNPNYGKMPQYKNPALP
jgi:hypothetical protein